MSAFDYLFITLVFLVFCWFMRHLLSLIIPFKNKNYFVYFSDVEQQVIKNALDEYFKNSNKVEELEARKKLVFLIERSVKKIDY